MSEPTVQPVEEIASACGVSTQQVQEIVRQAFNYLHRTAFFREEKSTAAIMESYFQFGQEACFHLAGLFALDRDLSDDRNPDRVIDETMLRFDPDGWTHFCATTVASWRAERSTP